MSKENKFVGSIYRFASSISQNKYINSIEEAFQSLTPIVIISAFATVFYEIILNNKTELGKFIWLHRLVYNLRPIANLMVYALYNFFTIWIVSLIGVKLGQKDKINPFFSSLIALMNYFAITPTFYNFIQGKKSILITDLFTRQFTGPEGLFLGIFIALISVQLYVLLNKHKNLQINSSNIIVLNILGCFLKLFLALLTVIITSTINLVLKLIINRSLFNIFFNLIQKPLQNLIQSLPGILLLTFAAQLFWTMGIHGIQMIKIIREPLLITSTVTNCMAYITGRSLPDIVTMPFWNMYIGIGGSGITISLLLAIFLTGKKYRDILKIAKASLIPGIFNINEQVIFGLPILSNPSLIVPFIITPLVTCTIGYIATEIGFAARAYAYTSCPIFLNGFLATGGNIDAVITQVICLVVAMLIYLPFVKIWENNKLTVKA